MSFTEAIAGLPVRADLCPCGIAALEKRQAISTDLECDPVWRDTPYRSLLLRHGLRSVWSTPILALSGRVLGTFAIYHHRPATPSPRGQELIEQVTHIASIAIERRKTKLRSNGARHSRTRPTPQLHRQLRGGWIEDVTLSRRRIASSHSTRTVA